MNKEHYLEEQVLDWVGVLLRVWQRRVGQMMSSKPGKRTTKLQIEPSFFFFCVWLALDRKGVAKEVEY